MIMDYGYSPIQQQVGYFDHGNAWVFSGNITAAIVVTPPVDWGYTIPDNQPQFAIPNNRPQFAIPNNQPQFTVPNNQPQFTVPNNQPHYAIG